MFDHVCVAQLQDAGLCILVRASIMTKFDPVCVSQLQTQDSAYLCVPVSLQDDHHQALDDIDEEAANFLRENFVPQIGACRGKAVVTRSLRCSICVCVCVCVFDVCVCVFDLCVCVCVCPYAYVYAKHKQTCDWNFIST
jgi:hypothetical protein